MFRSSSATIFRVTLSKGTMKRFCCEPVHRRFIVPFDTVHPEDGRRRLPKHVGVVNKQSGAFVALYL
jgi:hypothetical protein